MSRRLFSFLALGAALSVTAHAQLTTEETKGLQDTLLVGNMGPEDLNFPRPIARDAYALPFVTRALEKPIDGANALLTLHAQGLDRFPSGLVQLARRQVFEDKPSAISDLGVTAFNLPATLPQDVSDSVAHLVVAIQRANAVVRLALSKLTADEKRILVEELPALASDGQAKVFFSKGTAPHPDIVMPLLAKVDLAAIRAAGEALTAVVEHEVAALKTAQKASKFAGVYKGKVAGMEIEIVGKDGYKYTSNNSSLCIALGSQAKFTGRYGAGVGYSSVLIDLSRDSRYDVSDAALGCGILGIGVTYVTGTRHIFHARSLAMGAGLAGVGVFEAEDGLNTFDTVAMSQGFGHFGIGILQCRGGENNFRSRYLSQGAAKTNGVGWLVVQAGRNQYRTGQLVKDAPDGYRACGQGFGTGSEEGLSGGLGLLTVKGAEDGILGDSLCQGAGISGGLGSAYNTSKGATWSATRKAQGVGLRQGAGYFFQLDGDSLACLHDGVGHGAGHDRGVGFLLARGSESVFTAREGKPGYGNANGLGICLIDGDNNRVTGSPATAGSGHGTGSVGLCVSLGAHNLLGDDLTDGQALTRDEWAAAYSNGIANESVAAAGIALPPLGSLPMPPEADMQLLSASLAANRSKLVGIGKPALMWLLQKQLGKLGSSDLHEVAFLVHANGADGDALLAPALQSPDPATAKNALLVALAADAKGVAANVAPSLKRPGLEALAAEACGQFGVKDTVSDLCVLAGSQDREIAAAAAIALARLLDERSLSTAQVLVLSENLPVRKAALTILAKFPSQGMDKAKALTAGGDMRGRRVGIELLSEIGTAEALDLAGAYLGDQDGGVRLQAALALNARCPVKFRTQFLALKQDTDPLVRAVASRLDPIR